MKKASAGTLGLAVAIIVMMLMPTAQAESSGLINTFSRGTGGWTLVGDAIGAYGDDRTYDLVPQRSETEGNPGGALFAVDGGIGLTFYFQAPPRYLGNQRDSYGGTLEFDLKYSGPGNDVHDADVILSGGGLTLVLDAGPSPTTEWTHYTVVLDESAGWRIADLTSGDIATASDIKRVLKRLTVLRIRGEYTNNIDTGFLDNVRLTP